MKRIVIHTIVFFLVSVGTVFAHQPYILDGIHALVPDPEISKVYYGKLDGVSHTYFFTAKKSFAIYVNLLVPKMNGAKTDFSLEIRRGARPGDEMKLITEVNGIGFNWKEYFETFARDYYFRGPEYRADAPSGFYEIIVRNPSMSGKYAIAIGEEESFAIFDIARLLVILPRLKSEFFDTSPLYGLMNYVGFGVLLFLIVITGVVVVGRRMITTYIRKRNEPTIPELLGKPPEEI